MCVYAVDIKHIQKLLIIYSQFQLTCDICTQKKKKKKGNGANVKYMNNRKRFYTCWSCGTRAAMGARLLGGSSLQMLASPPVDHTRLIPGLNYVRHVAIGAGIDFLIAFQKFLGRLVRL